MILRAITIIFAISFSGSVAGDPLFKVSKVSCIPEISYFEIETKTLWNSWIPHKEQELITNHSMYYGDFDTKCTLEKKEIRIKVTGLNTSSGRSKTSSLKGGNIKIIVNDQIIHSSNKFHVASVKTNNDEGYIINFTEGGKRGPLLLLKHCIHGECNYIKNNVIRALSEY